MSTTINIKGLAELQRALEQLPAKIDANVMRGAMRAGAKVLAAEVKANVPEQSGALKASVKYGSRLDKRTGNVTAYVRAGGRDKKGGAAAFYAHMVEFGTAAHVITAAPGKRLAFGGGLYSSVDHPGAQKKPFMRPALDAGAGAAVAALGEYVRKRLSTKYGIDVPAPADPQAEPDE